MRPPASPSPMRPRTPSASTGSSAAPRPPASPSPMRPRTLSASTGVFGGADEPAPADDQAMLGAIPPQRDE